MKHSLKISSYLLHTAVFLTFCSNASAQENVAAAPKTVKEPIAGYVVKPAEVPVGNGEAVATNVLVPVNQEGKMQIPEDDKGIFSVVWENDIFSGTDSNYTNGARFAWLSPEKDNPLWVDWVAKHMMIGSETTQSNNRYSVALGQNIYTPRDLEARNVVKDDRPYAGHTYGSVGIVSDTGKTYDNIQLTLGIVGPASGARNVQQAIHHLINDEVPNGWKNQLKNEPTVGVTYERKWRNLYESSPSGLGMDLTPSLAATVGNADTHASTGAIVRLGYDLPADYGPPRIRPSLPGSDFFIPTKEVGGYLFGGVEGRAVARNIFLDGNTFEDSHSVDKEYLVGNAQVGAAVTWGDTRVSYTHVFNTKEFRTQEKPEQFGVLSLSLRF